MRRRLVAFAALASGWLVGIAIYRRASAGRRERIDLYFEDGSMQTLADGTAGTERLLQLAHEALRAARGA